MPFSDWVLDKRQLENVDNTLRTFEALARKFDFWIDNLFQQTIPTLEYTAKNLSSLSSNATSLSSNLNFQISHFNDTCNMIINPFHQMAYNMTSSMGQSLQRLDELTVTINNSIQGVVKEVIDLKNHIVFCVYCALLLLFIVVLTYVYTSCCRNSNDNKFKRE